MTHPTAGILVALTRLNIRTAQRKWHAAYAAAVELDKALGQPPAPRTIPILHTRYTWV